MGMEEGRIELGTASSSPLLVIECDRLIQIANFDPSIIDTKPHSIEIDLLYCSDPPDGCKHGGNQGEGNRDKRLKCRPDCKRGGEYECDESEGNAKRGVDPFAESHAGTVGERRVTLNYGLHPPPNFCGDACST